MRKADESPGGRSLSPGLVFVLWADRPGTPPSRHSLAHVTEVVLGRGETRAAERAASQLSLRFPDQRMSSEHARLSRALGNWILSDAGSKNGTYVNGHPIDHTVVHDGDIVEVGHTFWLFRDPVPGGGDEPLDREGSLLPASDVPGMTTLSAELAARLGDLTRVAPSAVPIVLAGESGTGKEIVARAAHTLSQRKGAFIAVNCGALPETLVEAELFGYRKGAFSGALRDQPGLVRAADGGTLFLDEIGDLPLASQTAFLRVLQQGEVTPVGGTQPVSVEVRLIAATHRDLEALVSSGRFRQDLWARLAGLSVCLPPLRARREDLGILAGGFLAHETGGTGGRLTLSRDAARAVMTYEWPLNVRELERALALAAALRAGSGEIELDHLPPAVRRGAAAAATAAAEDAALDDDNDGAEPAVITKKDLRRRAQIVDLLREHQGNISAVARALGKARNQVQRWIKRYEIGPEALKDRRSE